MTFELWQVPLLAAGAIMVIEYAARLVMKKWPLSASAKRVRTYLLAALAFVMFVLLVIALPTTQLSAVTTVANLVLVLIEAYILRLTYLSYQEMKAERGKNPPLKVIPGGGNRNPE